MLYGPGVSSCLLYSCVMVVFADLWAYVGLFMLYVFVCLFVCRLCFMCVCFMLLVYLIDRGLCHLRDVMMHLRLRVIIIMLWFVLFIIAVIVTLFTCLHVWAHVLG